MAGVVAGVGVILWMSIPGLNQEPAEGGAQFHTYLTIVFGTTAIFVVGFLVTLVTQLIGFRVFKK